MTGCPKYFKFIKKKLNESGRVFMLESKGQPRPWLAEILGQRL